MNPPPPRRTQVGWRSFLAILILVITVLPMACKKKEIASPAKATETIRSGLKLTGLKAKDAEEKPKRDPNVEGFTIEEVQAAELEAKLLNDPENEPVRRQLLTYYSGAQYKSEAARKARYAHILWLIEHHPETDMNGPLMYLNRTLDGEVSFERAKKLWLKQVQDNPENLAILHGAATFCLLEDRKTTEELWKKAQQAEPANPKWAQRLAHLYSLSADSQGTNPGPAAGKALEEMEKAQASTPGNFENLDSLAKMAFKAGEMEKAGGYARDLLEQAPSHRKAWNYGNALHTGNLILGRIALRKDKLDEAKHYLLEAGQTPGSPQLNSFGPNMSLAKELAEKGEKETVVSYLKLCEGFWKMGSAKLDEWSKEINAGRIPDFGGNLLY